VKGRKVWRPQHAMTIRLNKYNSLTEEQRVQSIMNVQAHELEERRAPAARGPFQHKQHYKPPDPDLAVDTRTIERVVSILQVGNLNKASHAAFQSPMQPMTPESFQELVDLHPDRPAPEQLPKVPKLSGGIEAPYSKIEPNEDLRNFVKKQCEGKRVSFMGCPLRVSCCL
jgi:hypothetical protein